MSVEQMQTVELPVPKLSKIPLGHDVKMSWDIGELRLLNNTEVYPGDIFEMSIHYMVRFMPLVVPIFHRLDIKFRTFFVPNRLVWDNWQDFITYKLPDVNSPTFTCAQINDRADASSSWTTKGLLWQRFDDYDVPINLGLDTNNNVVSMPDNTLPLNVLPLRAGNFIWNEYFRHQFLQNELNIWNAYDVVSQEEVNSYTPLTIGWEKDYFTLSTTEPQLGDAVSLPISNNINVRTTIRNVGPNTGGPIQVDAGSSQPIYAPSATSVRASEFDLSNSQVVSRNQFVQVGTIQDFYNAKALQRWKYKLQLAGNRYNEQILAKFGVVTPDYRVQRPEYIGGDTKAVSIGRVLNTNGGEGSVLGSYAGEASVFGSTKQLKYNVQEYGMIQTYFYMVPTSSYCQGLQRVNIKRDIFDWYDPDFARVGDQEVLNDEIYVQSGDNNGIFGYQMRYSQYKFISDKIRGEFRTNLAFWHMARMFDSLPSLNSLFVEMNPTDSNLIRQWSVTDTLNTDHLLSEFYLDIMMYRPMPIDSLPEYVTDFE